MQNWHSIWREVRATLIAGLGRFPTAVVTLAIFATEVNLEIAEIIEIEEDTLVRNGIALVGAAAVAAAAVLFGERRAIAAVPRLLLSLLLAATVGAALWHWDRLAIAYPALFVAAVLTIPLAPYLRSEPTGFWTFGWCLVHAAALALIATVVFCLGLSAIFASVDYLFGVSVDSSLYGHIWAIGLGFVGPTFALSLIPSAFPENDAPAADDIFVTGLRFLSDFVAVPLLAIYVAILHAYAVKILVEGELPKGQIGWMVLTFGLAVLALRIAVHPMATLSRMPTRAFLRWWPLGLGVPLVLLAIALWQRVEAYGVTPERYGVGLLGLFFAAVLITQLVPRLRNDIRMIVALAALALLVGSVGPWGMFAVSARSQTDRLMQHLADARAIEDGALTIRPSFSQGIAQDVRSIVSVLHEMHQLDRLRPLFAGQPDDPFTEAALLRNDQEQRTRIWAALNVGEVPSVVPVADDGVFHILGGPTGTAIEGYDIVIAGLAISNPQPLKPDPDFSAIQLEEPNTTQSFETVIGGVPLNVLTKGATIEIKGSARAVSVSHAMLRETVARRLETIEKQFKGGERPPQFFIEVSPAGTKAGLLFSAMSGKLTNSEFALYNGTFDLFLRRADWQAPASGGEAPRLPEP